MWLLSSFTYYVGFHKHDCECSVSTDVEQLKLGFLFSLVICKIKKVRHGDFDRIHYNNRGRV